jgi:hypothetical protein
MLFVGSKLSKIIRDNLPTRYLLINDGEVSDDLVPPHNDVLYFDPAVHSFDVLEGMNHRRARDLANVLYAADPGGENTLTVRNGKRALSKLLLDAKSLDHITGNRKDPAIAEALGLLEDVLFSPLVRNVLCRRTNFSFLSRHKGKRSGPKTIIARLNRAELGDKDCFIIGNLLALMYQGHIVIPDFGFYACPSHMSLIRQQRLTAGVRNLEQLPPLFRQAVLQLEPRTGAGATFDDAETLALTAGKIRGVNDFHDEVQKAMKG